MSTEKSLVDLCKFPKRKISFYFSKNLYRIGAGVGKTIALIDVFTSTKAFEVPGFAFAPVASWRVDTLRSIVAGIIPALEKSIESRLAPLLSAKNSSDSSKNLPR